MSDWKGSKPPKSEPLSYESTRAAMKSLLRAPTKDRECYVPCKGCKELFDIYESWTYCPKCGLNFFWVDKGSEYLSGPQYKGNK